MTHKLVGEPAEVRMTLEITRAATGNTETVELVGFTDPADLERHLKENANGEEANAQG